MGLLDSIQSLFRGSGGQGDGNARWVYVRCGRCGEAIKTRIDLRNDLSRLEGGGFVVNKTLVGSQRCFERIQVTLTFDDNYKVVGREIVRGEFITAEEFEAAAGN
ncbi:MAG: hypothetical protein Kow0063_01220 [Anaerolineae bacterium]